MRFAVFSNGHQQILHPEGLPNQGIASLSPYTSFAKLASYDQPTLDYKFQFSHSLRRILQDKLLLLSELPFSLEFIYKHYLHGYIGFKKSIKRQHDEYICERCGNDSSHLFASHYCARCHDSCTYCRKCIMMGKVSECEPLVYWCGPLAPFEWASYKQDALQWDGQLSPEQAYAAKSVTQAIAERKRLLIWAVCGSGKTELIFPGISYAFEQGLRVCIATPRVDVVLELEPRLKEAFPTVSIASLYGGSKQRKDACQLTISTTHQLLRYQEAFDVLIIDEVDAFPYSFDPMLAYAVERAKKTTAATIMLTATPNDELKREVKIGRLSVVKIPIRYHRHPLPVPRFVWCGNWEKRLKKRKLPEVVLRWCEQRFERNRQFLFFVPSIDVAERVKAILKVPAVYADDPERKTKVEQFRRGEIKALVTTTILERGVTIPSIDVAVLGSERDIFTESALVQIAGRVGRSAQDPYGDVCFFHFGRSKAMVQAKRHICEMNEES